jgi:RNA polymerase sigma-70 factor (ECF subfamily)
LRGFYTFLSGSVWKKLPHGKKTRCTGNYTKNAAPSVPGGTLQVRDDTELARQIGHGDEKAFQTLMDRHGRYLYGIAFALAGNAPDAEDLVQETFVGAFRGRFRGDASLRTWLVGILVRQAGMLRRSRHRRGVPLSLQSPGAAEPMQRGAGSAAVTGVDARLDLSAMLESLSAEHRAVIVLRELQGMSYEEIARTLELPRGTVESRLFRAREELRRRFKGYL